MSNIKRVRFVQSIFLAGHMPSEPKQVDASDAIKITESDTGVTLSWTEINQKDVHADNRMNDVASTFVPMHNILQIIYKNAPFVETKIKKQK